MTSVILFNVCLFATIVIFMSIRQAIKNEENRWQLLERLRVSREAVKNKNR